MTTNGGILPYNWIWSNKAITEDLLNIPLGLYSVSVTDKNKCKASASFDVQAQYWVTANAGNDSTVCPYTQFQLNGRGKSSDGGILIYNWVDLLTNSTVALSEKPVMYLPPIANRDSSTHTYILSVYNQMSCFATDTVKIKVAPVHGLKIGAHLPYEFAIRDTVSVGYMLPLQLEALPDSFVKYTWSPAVYIDDTSSRTPTVTLPEWALYTVRAITREGCAETSYIGIDVAGRIIVPTGFTPNGDDKNEFWEIDNAEYYPNIVVQVFNRWGEKVYESKGYNNDDIKFDGKRNGRNLPSGTYYYIITIDKKIESKGPVTIIR